MCSSNRSCRNPRCSCLAPRRSPSRSPILPQTWALTSASPLARTPEERSFTSTDDWRASDIRGRITRAVDNGFALQTETQGELEFDPAKIGPDGKVEPNPLVKDVVTGLVGDLAYCRPRPTGVFNCVALHNGREVAIAQAPVGRPL